MAPDYYSAHRRMQHDLDNISNWCKGDKLTLNIKETKTMLLGTKHKIKKIYPIPLVIDTTQSETVMSYKYLGITIDQILTFTLHMLQIIKTVHISIIFTTKVKEIYYMSCSFTNL